MSEHDALHRWCARMGIAPDFHDIWGHYHQATDDGLRALLRELGIDDPSAAALQAAEATDWAQMLAPVVCATAGEPGFDLSVRVPAGGARLHWHLVEEGGSEQSGEIDAASCTVERRATTPTGERVALQGRVAASLRAGYHRLRLTVAGMSADATLVVAPAQCYRPAPLQGDGRVWGPTLQLYSLRSDSNWGIGDFGDLARLTEDFGAQGAGLVGVNPLHALFPHNPHHLSPYSPSSRSQLNVIYIAVEAIPELGECDAAQQRLQSPEFQARLDALRAAPHVDYPGVFAAKFEMLALLHAHFRERHLDTASARGQAFRTWQAERGEALALHASFEALQEHFHGADPDVWGWPRWPAAYHDPRSPAVRRFQAEHAARIDWFAWLQWVADQQLAQVSTRCRARGFAVGLYLDLAVSVDRAGSDSWAHSALYATGASVGAPPDELSLNGQDWGLPPLKPRALVADRFAFFRDTLRACMRHAGALRIDHVMGLMRLYWIAPGQPASAGAYVHYPLHELLAVVALESERNQCMVIGEDLGTVADEMRAALARHEVLSYRLLYFERGDEGAFKPAEAYPLEALVAVSTHDLPTIAGWWCAHDIDVRARLGQYPEPGIEQSQRAGRANERARLLAAIDDAGLLPQGLDVDPATTPSLSQPLLEAIHAFLASTPSRVMVMQLEDALGVLDQANLPGTVDQHPNWRQKLPASVQDIATDARVRGLCARLAQLRPHAPLRDVAPLRTDVPGRAEAVVPRATYRLQFHSEFTFDHAIAILPYLQRLGVSHVYCSPLTRAKAGSRHGYDVVAYDEINPELGGRAGFDRFSAAARAAGLGLLLDMVPNHMGIGPDNPWWTDVLESGPASAWAGFFDIDWHPVDPALDGKVLLPVLGDHIGRVLDAGELVLAFEPATGGFVLRYWEHAWPVDPRSVAALLQQAAARCEGVACLSLQGLADAFAQLPPRDTVDAIRLQTRRRDTVLLKKRLATLVRLEPAVQTVIDHAVAAANEPDAIDRLHEAQAYRLAFWRVASDEINYRRFFDVNELAALRMEDPAVFEATHGFALDLAAAGLVDGLRIDHPDGLHDPAQYFDRLQQGYARRAGLSELRRDERGRLARPLYVVAEKIAARHEDMPGTWAVHGTTGYRFANVVNGVLIDTGAAATIDRLWRRFSGEPGDFAEAAYLGKRGIMRSALASELTVLATELLRIARAHRHSRDYTYNALRESLAEVAACMPVYRTYVVDTPSAQDQRFIDWAVAHARQRTPAADPSVLDFVRQTLLARAQAGADAALAEQVRRFAMRFQQFTSPVAAKGVEDTAFYRYVRLLPLNEVGGEPGRFGISLRGFHAANADRATRWPHTLIATSTHDNKRSEDVRCRLDVLSETPSAWRLLLRRVDTSQQLQRARATLPEALDEGSETLAQTIPSRADEYLIVQTLLGTLPAGGLTEGSLPGYRERIEQHVLKCLREAKHHTSWISPDAVYEDGVLGFLRSLLARVGPNPALTELQGHAEALAFFGAFNSATMVVLKYTAPGVPDLYQGNEMMDLSLVDPDNRRPVDYASRARLLDELDAAAHGDDLPTALATMAATPQDGRLKLWLTWRLLQLRRAQPALFRDAGYETLPVRGAREANVVAFARQSRGGDAARAVTVAGRLYAGLLGMAPGAPTGGVWGDTAVELPGWPDGTRLRNELTGETVTVVDGRVALAELFATLPLAVLIR